MNRITTHILCGLIMVAGIQSASAQFLTLEDHGGNVVNSTTITKWVADTTNLAKVELPATLNLGQATTVGCKRYEVNVQPSTGNYFCWALCYLEWSAGQFPFFDGPDKQAMQSGSTFNGFTAYHIPYGEQGCSTYRYVWYDDNNPTDTVWVDIMFCTTAVGIDDVGAEVNSFEIFPNPATGGSTAVDLNLEGVRGNVDLVMHNALGEHVFSRSVNPTTSKTILELDELQQGVYFCSVLVNDRVLETKRVMITD